jgi:hypothetical protein
MKTTTTKVYKTNNDTILIVTADVEGCAGRHYVSVTASEISPLTKENAREQTCEMLEDGEMWRDAVADERTDLGLSDWVDMVINNDGDISMIDNSLYPDEMNIEGKEYIFDSHGCGCMHDDIKAVTNEFNELISLHLNDDVGSINRACNIIDSIKGDDVGFEVEKYAREILEIEA